MSRLTAVAIVLLALAATGYGQYIVDSAWTGRYVTGLVYNRPQGYMVGIGEEGIFSIWCERNNGGSGVYMRWPLGLALNLVSNRVYCAYGNGEDDTVLVAHGVLLNPYGRIPLAGASQPFWDSVGNRIYVACAYENEVAVLDCATDSVIAHVHVGQEPERPELNTRRRKLYVRNRYSESVSIIDLATLRVVKTLAMGNVPACGYYCAAVDKYYCGTYNRVVVVCGAGDSVVAVIEPPAGFGTYPITGLGSDTLIAVAVGDGLGHEEVWFVDTRADTVSAVVPVGRGRVRALLYSAASGLLYAACHPDEVAVLSADGSGVRKRLRVGYWPSVMVAAPEYGYVYVAHRGCSWSYVIKDSVTGMEEPGPVAGLPAELRAGPNPFRRVLTVELPAGAEPKPVRVHSVDGRLVAELEPRPRGGRLAVEWTGRTANGGELPSGAYVVSAAGAQAAPVVVVKVE
jgi:YVTN family beta-propeller protein